jgi:hypothetical protein
VRDLVLATYLAFFLHSQQRWEVNHEVHEHRIDHRDHLGGDARFGGDHGGSRPRHQALGLPGARRGRRRLSADQRTGESVWDKTRDVPVEPGPAGTTGRMGSVFYWLENNDDLKEHIGHRVDIDGALKGDLNEGQIKVDRKANWTEMEVKRGERTLKARVPQSLFVYPASSRDSNPKVNVLVRKVDVKKVSMRAASCD